jgi:hypothetical protein
VERNGIDDAGAVAPLRSPHAPRWRSLSLRQSPISPACAAQLVASPIPVALDEKLDRKARRLLR